MSIFFHLIFINHPQALVGKAEWNRAYPNNCAEGFFPEIIQMENRTCKTRTAGVDRSHSSARLKFREVNTSGEFNSLNSKYELYRQGTPNQYSEDLTALKANNLKNEVAMVELPAVDYMIAQMAQTHPDKHANQRNYDLYPSLLKAGHGRYKEMLSEKQEVRDFILWFEGQFQAIEASQGQPAQKFHDKQTLIAAGFTQMAGQVGKITKNRAEILKMLWNRENSEVKAVIESLNGQGIRKEKSLLEQISSIHKEYQEQIEVLRKNNRELEEKYSQEKVFSRACVNDLRILRKRIKKLEYVGRKLGESNGSLKKENLHLLEENIKLMTSIKEITSAESAVLNYRKLQLHGQRAHSSRINHRQLLALTQPPEETLTPLLDLEHKKDHLYQYVLERINENPGERELIKDEYFPDDEDSSAPIDHYFHTIINRPTVQIELLNEQPLAPLTLERAVNTLPPAQPEDLPPLTLEKGIQVDTRQTHMSLRGTAQSPSAEVPELERTERRFFHSFDKREQEHKEKESKLRIIQHRLSRKNSLNLLQLQNLSDFNTHKNDKKSLNGHLNKRVNRTNHRSKNSQIRENTLEESKVTLLVNDNQSEGSNDNQSEGSLLLENISNHSELMTIKVRPPQSSVARKSHFFKSMLENISENLDSRERVRESEDQHTIQLDGEEQEAIKLSQLDDLIEKHLQKNPQPESHKGPEKSLNKVLLALFKRVWHRSGINLKVELLEVVKQNYGNVKSVVWKFLSAVGTIKQNENCNSLLKVVSLLLKINARYASYNEVNTPEVADLYFSLCAQLTIKTIHDEGFNIWKTCTTVDKTRSFDFMAAVEKFFSQKKSRYLEAKITELLATSEQELKNKRNVRVSSSKKIQIVSEEASIIKLNPLLLYILEVYLIEKQLYHSSYAQLAALLSEEAAIQGEVFVWLLELLGFSEQKQKDILSFALPASSRCRSSKQTDLAPSHSDRSLKVDTLYRCCVKFDFPIMEELSVSTYAQLKRLPLDIQQNYYRLVRFEEWADIKGTLLHNYSEICESPVYLKAFRAIADKLENEIRKGMSIEGEAYREERLKKKEEVFSLLYRILIIESHRNLISPSQPEHCGEDLGPMRESQ